MPLIEPGRRAPAFSLRDQHGKTRRLADFAGSPVVLFFYPKDLSEGCTDEACQFQDLSSRFARRGVKVLGISVRDWRSKGRFADRLGLRYPLLADSAVDERGRPEPEVAPRYGVWVEKAMFGKRFMGIERTTYLIGPDGRVVRRWDRVRIPGHAEDVLGAVSELGL